MLAEPCALAGDENGDSPPLRMPPPDEELVLVLPRSPRNELRISLLRFLGTRRALVAVQEWRRDRIGASFRPLMARSLIRGSEISVVIEAMQRAVERARELGWVVR